MKSTPAPPSTAFGRGEHLVGRRRGEDLARAGGVEHAVADEAGVQRLVARAAARDQRHLAGLELRAGARTGARRRALTMSACAAAKPSSDSASTASTSLMSFFMVTSRWQCRRRLETVADRADDQRHRARARVDMAERALAEERGAALDRVHRARWPRRCRSAHWRTRATRSSPPWPRSTRCTGSSTSSSVFWPTSALPSRVSAAMPAAQRARQVGRPAARPAAPWPASPAACRTPGPTSRRWWTCRSCPSP